MARGDGAGLQDSYSRQTVRLVVIPLTYPCLASSADRGYEIPTREVSANGRSARNVLSRSDHRCEHPELSQINEHHGTGPHSPLHFGTRSSFLGSLGRGLCSVSCRMNFSHLDLVCSDSKNDCGHQSSRCCGTCDWLARSILFRSETFSPYPTTLNTWYRSCTHLSIFARLDYLSFFSRMIR